MRVKGRIWSRIWGVASRTSGSTALFAGSSLRIGARSDCSAGVRRWPNVLTFSSVSLVVSSVPGSLFTALEIWLFCVASDSNTAFDERTRRTIWRSLVASSVVSSPYLLIRFLRLPLRRATAEFTRARSRLVGPRRA